MIKEGSNVPRKGHTQKRDVLADPMYNSKVVTKLVNSIMLDGKKGVAQKIVYGAFATVEEKTGKPALEVFEEAMNNVMPALEVKARRIGGATYQVPIEVRPDRRQALGLRWLTTFSRARGEKTQAERLSERDYGCSKQYRCICKEKRRYAQNGRSKQSFRTLQILVSVRSLQLCFGFMQRTAIYNRVRLCIGHKYRRKKSWLEENIHLREPEISESWLILMLVRQH